jgi:hypothetical protein
MNRHDPLFATFILQGIIAMLKSYPTLSDSGLFTAMLALFPELGPGAYYHQFSVEFFLLTINATFSITKNCTTHCRQSCCTFTQRRFFPCSTIYGWAKAQEMPISSMRQLSFSGWRTLPLLLMLLGLG